ncbi:hypothetical protein CK226_20885 [Mesorhizobium sp. WSM4311]|uniref:hypothetical protein n=1 Tax=Mesorhizobium sp. WSM4305 TaxID=2589886 RepID=UPI000BAEE6E9|nr:hypothetical protein [Mesorhizobium sp. WSM4305]PBC21290.1 hypothetical protein CK226_20885 [Mesorhizobium sp. WSM4311]TRD04782.1 hypothetical protein FJV82_13060 [Mesorhizobium sp. WSM4305]
MSGWAGSALALKSRSAFEVEELLNRECRSAAGPDVVVPVDFNRRRGRERGFADSGKEGLDKRRTKTGRFSADDDDFRVDEIDQAAEPMTDLAADFAKIIQGEPFAWFDCLLQEGRDASDDT